MSDRCMFAGCQIFAGPVEPYCSYHRNPRHRVEPQLVKSRPGCTAAHVERATASYSTAEPMTMRITLPKPPWEAEA